MLTDDLASYSTGSYKLALVQSGRYLRKELVGGVTIAVCHQDFVADIQGLTARCGTFELWVLANAHYAGQDNIP